MNNVLITGANGQLGSELREICHNDDKFQFFFTDINDLDITSKQSIDDFLAKNKINFVVNCAAYTQVDRAEDDKQKADLINHIAVKYLAESCKKHDAFLIHISTDYVFAGKNNVPYIEDYQTEPLGVYGLTKLNGEKQLINSGCKYIIIRTSWLYSSFGSNFVKTIMRLAKEKEELKVVFDQVGTPTYAYDLAKLILTVLKSKDYSEKQGVYHFSNEGVCSWYDFAVQIRNLVGAKCEIIPCHSDEFPSKVKRPNFSVLDKTKIKETFNYKIPYWLDSLKTCMEKL